MSREVENGWHNTSSKPDSLPCPVKILTPEMFATQFGAFGCNKTVRIDNILHPSYLELAFNINGKDNNTEPKYDIVGVIHVAYAWMPLWEPK